MSIYSTFERGALFTVASGIHRGDTYQLVRESEGVYAKDATGKNIGAPQYLFNLVNLTNEGKARVSNPTRKLAHPTIQVPGWKIRDHFGLDLVPAGRIDDIKSEIKAGVARVAADNAARKAAADLAAALRAAAIRHANRPTTVCVPQLGASLFGGTPVVIYC